MARVTTLNSRQTTAIDGLWRIGLWIAYRLALVYWFLRRPVTRGAYVAVWCREELLIIRNSYKRQVTFPAGGPRHHEPLLECAVRELREEVGIVAEPAQLRLVGEYLNPGEFKRDRCQVFELHLADRPALQIDRREVVAAEFVPTDALAGRRYATVVEQYLRSRGLLSDLPAVRSETPK